LRNGSGSSLSLYLAKIVPSVYKYKSVIHFKLFSVIVAVGPLLYDTLRLPDGVKEISLIQRMA
jgi:hypothetical protein